MFLSRFLLHAGIHYASMYFYAARISIPELGKSMTGLGFPMDREEVVKVFRDIDKNGDNSIDFREFEKAFGQFM